MKIDKLLKKGTIMKIYNITRGQLITLWVFGFFLWVWSLSDATGWDPSVLGQILCFIIPAVLIFYTIGWRNYQKIKTLNSKDI